MAKKHKKKIKNFLSRIGLCWRSVYLVTDNDGCFLKSFFHDGETGKDYIKFTKEVKEAMFFNSFDKAYWWTYMLSSCTDPRDGFVTRAKVKGNNDHAKILLSEERYFA